MQSHFSTLHLTLPALQCAISVFWDVCTPAAAQHKSLETSPEISTTGSASGSKDHG